MLSFRRAKAGVANEVLAREVGDGEIEEIVVLPEDTLRRGAARGLGRGEGALMGGQGEVLMDDADLALVLLQHLVQHLLDALAVGSLVVGELHDGDGRIGRPADERGVDGHVAGLSRAGRAPEERGAEGRQQQ